MTYLGGSKRLKRNNNIYKHKKAILSEINIMEHTLRSMAYN